MSGRAATRPFFWHIVGHWCGLAVEGTDDGGGGGQRSHERLLFRHARVCVCVYFYYTPEGIRPEESPINYRHRWQLKPSEKPGCRIYTKASPKWDRGSTSSPSNPGRSLIEPTVTSPYSDETRTESRVADFHPRVVERNPSPSRSQPDFSRYEAITSSER